MKLTKALVLLAFALPAAVAVADPPARIGRLNYISGIVSFAPAEAADDWIVAELNRPITSGDRLWTDYSGRAELHVGSTAIRLTQRTNLDVMAIDDRSIRLRLPEGGLNVRLRSLAGGEAFEIDTPQAVVVLKAPGSYRVSVGARGTETTVAVRSGLAEVLAGTAPFPVSSGQQGIVTGEHPDASYEVVAAPPPDDFDQWALRRDAREDRLEATRYVPPEMTGYEDLDEHGYWRVVGEYGPVWIPHAVPTGWAPYRYGRWVWISPWGWTWVDSAPWGFAPFHYGRWVWLGSHWAWVPGPRHVRPVYAPALVAFIGGPHFSVSIGIGAVPAVAWVPLGWREPYIPWYRTSPTYVRQVNIAHVTHIDVTNIYNVTNVNKPVTGIRYANRSVPSAVTVVERDAFIAARPVHRARLEVHVAAIARAPVTSAAPVEAPDRSRFAALRSASRPPDSVMMREVFASPGPQKFRPVEDTGRSDRGSGVNRGDTPPQAVGGPVEVRSRPADEVALDRRRPEYRMHESERGATPAPRESGHPSGSVVSAAPAEVTQRWAMERAPANSVAASGGADGVPWHRQRGSDSVDSVRGRRPDDMQGRTGANLLPQGTMPRGGPGNPRFESQARSEISLSAAAGVAVESRPVPRAAPSAPQPFAERGVMHQREAQQEQPRSLPQPPAIERRTFLPPHSIDRSGGSGLRAERHEGRPSPQAERRRGPDSSREGGGRRKPRESD
jgi:hypothetical protein